MVSRKELIQVALGNKAADLVVKNGSLLNVYSGELLEKCSIAVSSDTIAYVGRDIKHVIDDHTRIIDASGKVVAPGLIDGHFHLYLPLEEFLEQSIPRGTTTVFMENTLGYNFGYEAAVAELENMSGQPINLYGLSTIYLGPSPFIVDERLALSAEAYAKLLKRDDVAALGECYWSSVLDEGNDILNYIEQALECGKQAEGHGAGLKGERLVAFSASGITSCHESINVSEVIDSARP